MANFNEEEEIKRLNQDYKSRHNLNYHPAVLGDVNGNIIDPNLPLTNVLIREVHSNGLGAPRSVILPPDVQIQMLPGENIRLGQLYGQEVVLGGDYKSNAVTGRQSYLQVQQSNSSHITQGDFATLNLVPSASPPNLTVSVRSWVIINAGTVTLFPGTTQDMTSFVPSAGNMCYACIFVKNDYATLEVKTSTPRSVTDLPLNVSDIQECVNARSTGSIPAWAVKLIGGQSAIALSDILTDGLDLRQLVNSLVDGIGGPGSSTDRSIATWNGTGGSTLRDNPLASVDSNGNVKGNTFVLPASSTLTIAAGVMTITKGFHLIESSSGTSDNLATINGGVAGQVLIIQADADDTITVKNGTGNINLNGGADFALSGEKSLMLFYDGTDWTDIGISAAGAGSGTVTSVALSMPAVFSVAGTPITTAGTFTVTLATESANLVWAGPTGGGAATPTFRALVAADIPNLPASIITSGQLALARGGTAVDLSATGAATAFLAQDAGHVISARVIADGDLPSSMSGKTLVSPVINTGVSGTAISTDGTFASPSDTILASQKATKTYVDAVATGLSPKDSVVVATAAALPSNVYNNGASGVGATLTGVATGVLTVDGHAVAINERLLVKDEAAPANAGIYLCTVAGAIGVAYVLTRATDNDTSAEIVGAYTFVETGSVNASAGFVNTNATAITIGTTAITWTQFSGAGEISAGTGLSKSGNTLSLITPVTLANGGTGVNLSAAGAGFLKQATSGANVTIANIVAGDIPNGATPGQPLLAGASVPAYGPLDYDNTNASTGLQQQKQVLAASTTIAAGYSVLIANILEVPAGMKLELAAGAIIEVT